MKHFLPAFFSLAVLMAHAQAPVESYPEDPASVEQAGVPKGEVLKFTFDQSAIYPGTWREYWVYIPTQYKADKPACVYVGQDGIQFKAPTVFDNLINAHEMPVTIGVFVMHGRVRAADTAHALDRFNRSFEYDGLGDAYARFILNEIFPDVEKHKTSDGRPIRLSRAGIDHAIGGTSSGAICAFTAAWERPDAFSKVFSGIGTYVGLRGGDRYPTLIRKYEPKPIRVFMQDGSNDNDIYAGDWFKANEMMERALTFGGYQVNHVWGEGAHNGKHSNAVFPQAMRWLWKNYPAPIPAGQSKNQFLSELLIPGAGWELVGDGYGFTEGTAANAAGEVFFQDVTNAKTYKVDTKGKLALFNKDSHNASGTAFSTDGRRFTVSGRAGKVFVYDRNEKETIVSDSVAGNDIVVANNGNAYITAPNGADKPGKVILITAMGEKRVVDEGLKFDNGLCLSPDGTQLYVTESASHWVWVYQVKPDGSLGAKQKYGWLHVPDEAENAWSDGIKCDRDGRVFVATRSGIQIMDQTGRVNAILPVPSGQASNLCFGGSNFDILYVSANDKVYRRRLNTRGVNTFEAPVKPKMPRL